jgi:hypothetical protein
MMIIEVTALSTALGHFSAVLDGATIVPKSRQPLLDGARAIHSTANSTRALVMQYSSSPGKDCLRTTVGTAAGLRVRDNKSGMPVFVTYASSAVD